MNLEYVESGNINSYFYLPGSITYYLEDKNYDNFKIEEIKPIINKFFELLNYKNKEKEFIDYKLSFIEELKIVNEKTDIS